MMNDPFHARDTFSAKIGKLGIYRLSRLEEARLTRGADLPYCLRVLLESALRNCDGRRATETDVKNVAAWTPHGSKKQNVPFFPARVVLQDFTGVPAVVDLAAMRDALKRLGGDPRKINPLLPVDLVIDHSVQVDRFGSADALAENLKMEFQRNAERYAFLRWGQEAFRNFRVVPPGLGIIHQVNLEFLAKGVFVREDSEGKVAMPDTLVGTDSHTTMINGLGVLGWGVGGIEAEAVMLGQPLDLLLPEVIGFELSGRLPPGATATDLVLTVTQILRAEGVVGKFVEYFGSATEHMTVADRALVANMAPEYGATAAFFPVDGQTLRYLRQTGRTEEEVDLVERYTKEQQLFWTPDQPTPRYTKVLHLDLGTVEPSLAGPKRPQDRVALKDVPDDFRRALQAPIKQRGFALAEEEIGRRVMVRTTKGDSPIFPAEKSGQSPIGHGAVVIAAITSCTNTSNPEVMLAAGLLAQKAVERGLSVPPYVKTSLAPGSRVVTDYLQRAGLDQALDALGFQTVGYGCTTCIGNSGPLPGPVAEAVSEGNLVAAAVLSGNRNFEGRIHPLVKANYLASPPLVVAYALAGAVDCDLTSQPLGVGRDGRPVYLREIWPSPEEVAAVTATAVRPEMFRRRYADIFRASPQWNAMPVEGGELYAWDQKSTYIQEPPFFQGMTREPEPIRPIRGARVLALLGDSITTDHISPAGAIAASGPAGKYLLDRGVPQAEFNSYGSRRGNDRVMIRGTFANVRLRNFLAPGTEGGVTRHLPDGEAMSIYDAAQKYRAEGVPLVILAGSEYGAGSSRDWAAKGTNLLGVRAVIASGYERIHRSNLVGMGVLPLQLPAGQSWETLGLSGEEIFDLPDLDDRLLSGATLTVRAAAPDGNVKQFSATVRIDTPIEREYYRHGGILPAVLRNLVGDS
ncbi:MAG: aconitate hydratase AcnA [Pirellulales bacterium]|nr:aconitate hydratase AcnA [Pirellulales bacterium]